MILSLRSFTNREFVYIEMGNPSPPEKKPKGEDEEEDDQDREKHERNYICTVHTPGLTAHGG